MHRGFDVSWVPVFIGLISKTLSHSSPGPGFPHPFIWTWIPLRTRWTVRCRDLFFFLFFKLLDPDCRSPLSTARMRLCVFQSSSFLHFFFPIDPFTASGGGVKFAACGKTFGAKKHRTSRKPIQSLATARNCWTAVSFQLHQANNNATEELERRSSTCTLALAVAATSFYLQVVGFCASAVSLHTLRLICIHATELRP